MRTGEEKQKELCPHRGKITVTLASGDRGVSTTDYKTGMKVMEKLGLLCMRLATVGLCGEDQLR